MAVMISAEGEYKNRNAVSNVIRYVTRTRFDEKRKDELICFGGCGVSFTDPTYMIRQFSFVQEVNPSKNPRPRRIYHEVFSLDDNEDVIMCSSIDLFNEFALSCCNYWFYEMGFQAVYAIHKPTDKRLHIHFAINTTSYLDGKMRHENMKEISDRQALFIMWFTSFLMRAKERINAMNNEKMQVIERRL